MNKRELGFRTAGIEPAALRDLKPCEKRTMLSSCPDMVPEMGVEPIAYWLRVSCSADWSYSDAAIYNMNKKSIWWILQGLNLQPFFRK